MVHNRDRGKNFQNSLIEHTSKAAFRALDVFQKPSRPSSDVIKVDLEVETKSEVVLGVFKNFQNRPKSPSSSISCICSPKEVDISTKNVWCVLKSFLYPGLCGIKIFAL